MKKLTFLFILIAQVLLQNSAFAGGSDGCGPIQAQLKDSVSAALGFTQVTASFGDMLSAFCERGLDLQAPNLNEQLASVGCDCATVRLNGTAHCESIDSENID